MSEEMDYNWLAYLLQGGANALTSLSEDQKQLAKNYLSRQPRFDVEGDYEVTVVFACAEASRFDAEEICIALYCWCDKNQTGDWWRGSMSSKYMQGNNADKTYCQNTMNTLARIGFDGETYEDIQKLVGKKTSAYVVANERNGKTYRSIAALGTSFSAPKSIQLKSLGALPGRQPAPVPAPAPAGYPAPMPQMPPAPPMPQMPQMPPASSYFPGQNPLS